MKYKPLIFTNEEFVKRQDELFASQDRLEQKMKDLIAEPQSAKKKPAGN